jgi:recombination protein RecA
MHDRGISREGDLLDMAIEDKIVDKSGAWINYGELRLGQGRENAKQFLRENPNLIEEIAKKVLEKRSPVATPVAETNGEAEKEPETPPVLDKPRRGKQAAAATNNNHAAE